MDMAFLFRHKTEMPDPADALPGRERAAFDVPDTHFVLGTPLEPPFPEGVETAVFGARLLLGCGARPSGGAGRLHDRRRLRRRAHAEPHLRGGLQRSHRPHRGRARRLPPRARSPTRTLLKRVLGGPRPDPGHAPGQRCRHAVPLGRSTRPRTRSARPRRARASATRSALSDAGYGEITTEIVDAPAFYYAEDYHQQYLAKNPNGYCGLGGTGVSCPVGVSRA